MIGWCSGIVSSCRQRGPIGSTYRPGWTVSHQPFNAPLAHQIYLNSPVFTFWFFFTYLFLIFFFFILFYSSPRLAVPRPSVSSDDKILQIAQTPCGDCSQPGHVWKWLRSSWVFFFLFLNKMKWIPLISQWRSFWSAVELMTMGSMSARQTVLKLSVPIH
jgi:hypothetical protein